MKVTANPRPFTLTFFASGASYQLSSAEAQRLLDSGGVHSATTNRVVFHGHNTSDPKQRVALSPATRGGGPAFEIERHT